MKNENLSPEDFIRNPLDIALSALIKYMKWEEQYNTEIKEQQKAKIIKLQS